MPSYFDQVIAGQAAADAARKRRKRSGKRKSARLYGNALNPFVGVDGEGAGTDDQARQNYLLLQAGDARLWDRGRPLSTRDCLDFLLSIDKAAIHVGYCIDYDVTQILRDLAPKYLDRLFNPTRPPSSYVRWLRYGVCYMPRQFFRVCRMDDRGRPIKGSSRTVYDVSGFFLAAFVEAIGNFNIGTQAERDLIAAGKKRRGGDRLTQADLDYCKLECRLLAELMEAFRRQAMAAGIVPRQWSGAGWLATKLHHMNGTPRHVEKERDPELQFYANAAFYGGRFEATRFGAIRQAIYAYDIHSAYAAAMPELPCPEHTAWKPLKPGKGLPTARVYVADVSFSHKSGSLVYGLPVRSKRHRLFWPKLGRGVYWAPELRAAAACGLRVQVHGGFEAVENCSCRPYDWVRGIYQLRDDLGRDRAGYPLKIGLAGLYGKLCQRIGVAPYRDIIAAGLITAATRAKLVDAYRDNPGAVVMLATDGIYSLDPLPVDLGDGLGQWSERVIPDGLFIVQPGFYWPLTNPDSGLRSRGIPLRAAIDHRPAFEAAWSEFMAKRSWETPRSTLALPAFVGLRLAAKNPNGWHPAGRWVELEKEISFSWHHKRRVVAMDVEWDWRDGHVLTWPWNGSRHGNSAIYAGTPPDMIDEQLLEFEAMPDFAAIEPEAK